MANIGALGAARLKRESLLAEQRLSLKDPVTLKSKEDLAPPDKYRLVHVMFFFFGLGGILPFAFFTVAQDYWMYKFRDPISEDYDLTNKTVLQRNFLSISSMIHTVPSILTTLLTVQFGHKINILHRLIGAKALITLVFIVFTGFVKINTDSWQLEFFILTIIVSTGITVASGLLMITTLALISRFPQTYMKTQAYGSAASGLFSVILQIICLSTGGSPTTVALIYFTTGTIILMICLLCAIFCRNIPRFAYYLGDVVADMSRPNMTFKEVKSISKKLWPKITLSVTGLITAGMGHPTITTMVVSEYYGTGSLWAKKYYTPTITFLWTDVAGLVGRYFSFPFLTPKNALLFVLTDSARIILLQPLFLFCNAQPRKHLPVWFPHDWEYGIIVTLNAIAGSFLEMGSFMSMENLCPGQVEQGFLVMSAIGSIFMVLHSFMGTFWINMI